MEEKIDIKAKTIKMDTGKGNTIKEPRHTDNNQLWKSC